MKQIEKAIAIPVARMVRPGELALGAAIIVAGLSMLAVQLVALI